MQQTSIEWTDVTWNVVTGCTKVSPGCKYCYAERLFPRPYPGRAFTDVQCHPERLGQPVRWRKPRKVFVNSMSDLFHEAVPDAFIDRVYAVMALCPQHVFQVLTKRSARMRDYLGDEATPERVTLEAEVMMPAKWNMAWQHKVFDVSYDEESKIDDRQVYWPLPNVWQLVSVENQATADTRIPDLLRAPAAIRGISAEPLLGPIDLTMLHHDGITNIDALAGKHGLTMAGACEPLDWVIAGGESGPRVRPCNVEWARAIRDQCQAAGVPFFFKQWGRWVHESQMSEDAWAWMDAITTEADRSDGYWPVGKKRASHLLDKVMHQEFPRRAERGEQTR